jgi:hypothetical protein
MTVASTVEKIEKALSNMPNFDINVYKYSDDLWRLCPYTLVETEDGTSTGVEMHHLHMEITEEEALQLGLGGELWEDDDWIDKDTLVREFGVSDRIKTWIEVVESVIDKLPTKV